MQNLDVISINLWQILISLCNLLILFFILKKFLYKPVCRITEEREKALRERYSAAEKAQSIAEENRIAREKKLLLADEEAKQIISRASERADRISNKMLLEAKENADTIIKDAKTEAEFEYKKAHEKIKKEIVDVSATLTEKILSKELTESEHRSLIDKAIAEMSDDNE